METKPGDIKAYFVNLEASDLHTFTTLLDSRYKGCFLQKKENTERVKKRPKNLAKDLLDLRNFEAAGPIPNTVDSVDDIEKDYWSLIMRRLCSQ